jgi:pimeloyl-ACP methyl ester carboxylesterase
VRKAPLHEKIAGAMDPSKPRPRGARKIILPSHSGRVIPERFGKFKSSDGTEIFYAIEGEGEPLIFCYGLVCSSLHWTYQIDHFKHSHQAIWFDYRGHHNSEKPEDLSSITIPNFASDLLLLLDHLKIKEATLIGHSMGVSVALEFAHRFPDRVKSLVLANGTAQRPLETLLHNPNLLPMGFELLHRLYRFSPDLFLRLWELQKGNPIARAIVRLGGFNPHLAAHEDIERYVSQIEEMDPGVLLQVLKDYQAFDASPWLHTLQAPTLILAGDTDLVTPPAQQKLLHQLMPHSTYSEILHGSHCPQMDQPELVSARIAEFLKNF